VTAKPSIQRWAERIRQPKQANGGVVVSPLRRREMIVDALSRKRPLKMWTESKNELTGVGKGK